MGGFRCEPPVHPHARGERPARTTALPALGGSSPRTWGTLQPSRRRESNRRFIPTHVGNATAAWARRPVNAVHPHARGERQREAHIWPNGVGSSPRTWGTHQHPARARSAPRFIPTHVGNAKCASTWSAGPAVHPHARGERLPPHRRQLPPCGSSPRTWGTRVAALMNGARTRFIPTHVGNAACLPSWPVAASVHPHARGERLADGVVVHLVAGSSPRTWGTLTTAQNGSNVLRFIPTHVGNARRMAAARRGRAVHPHARGER